MKKLLMRGSAILLLLPALLPRAVGASTYWEAIARAQDFSGLPASTNLLTLSYDRLITTNVGGATYLKTVSLMTGSTWSNYYQPYEGWAVALSNGAGYESWVSFEPELKEYVTARTNEFDTGSLTSVAMRAEQVLGISNAASHLFAAVLWVAPDGLFRPAINWTTTNAATFRDWTDHDTDGPAWFGGTYGRSYFSWFTNRQATIYAGSGAFPWTGLGYSFDWFYDTNSPGVIGVSEFVIGAQRTYYVDSGSLVDEYFDFAIPEPGGCVMVVAALPAVSAFHALRRRAI